MGFFDSLMGNASEISVEQVEKDFAQVLAKSEHVEKAYKLIRDLFIFTNKRLILVDKQGLTGRKMDIHSIPYKSITHFSIETAGNFDMDAELKIWISGLHDPIEKQFNKSLNIYELQSVLAAYVLPD
ncbi:MAG TPA: cytoplasmic protein [Paenibacillaceae bacterium]|nr:cytoplasmic protein [Paenibacillaceae bacterium]